MKNTYNKVITETHIHYKTAFLLPQQKVTDSTFNNY